MKNLAGDPSCDEEIERELARCGIEIVRGERSTQEVAASITGKLNGFTFRRAWYYWVAEGPMPLEVAIKLYDHPVGRTDIRTGGYAGNIDPREYGTDYFDADGNQLSSDPTGAEAEAEMGFVRRGWVSAKAFDGHRFVPDKRVGYASAFVRSYHVDSELGLYILAHAIRALAWMPPPVDVSFDLSPEVHDAMDKMIESLGPELAERAAAAMPEHLPVHWQRLTEERDAALTEVARVRDRLVDITDDILGLQPPDTDSIALLDALEKRCNEARQDYADLARQLESTTEAYNALVVVHNERLDELLAEHEASVEERCAQCYRLVSLDGHADDCVCKPAAPPAGDRERFRTSEDTVDELFKSVSYYLPKPLPCQAILERAHASLAELRLRARGLEAQK